MDMQISFIAGSTMAIAGMLAISMPPAVEWYRIFRGGMPIDACVCERKEMRRRGKTYIKLTWKYRYMGTEYMAQSRYWSPDDGRKVGCRGAVLLRRNNPESAYDFMPKYQKNIIRAIGVATAIAGFILMAESLRMINMTGPMAY